MSETRRSRVAICATGGREGVSELSEPCGRERETYELILRRHELTRSPAYASHNLSAHLLARGGIGERGRGERTNC